MKLQRSLTGKERLDLRERIVSFFSKPRTYEEVAKHFDISGISAQAFLVVLKYKNVCRFNEKTKTYKKA